MLKDTGYQEKIEMLLPWFEEIIDDVKKDLKNEHLKLDKLFCKKYFLGKHYQHVQPAEMAAAYQTDISGGNVGLGEFIATRWLLKNTDIYGYFEVKLKAICPDFEQLEELPKELAQEMMQASLSQFGAKKTYLFSVFNSVVFPREVYEHLKEKALTETKELKTKKESELAATSFEAMKEKYEHEIKSLSERYEKKFSGLQRKYLNDVEALKKQIRTLQKKISNE